MKKRKYTAETDFENNEFADLIKEIGDIEDEPLSPDFDDRLYSRIDRIKLKKPLMLRMLALSTTFFQTRRQISLAYGAVFSLMLVASVVFFMTRNKSNSIVPEKQAAITDTAAILYPQDKYLQEKDNNIVANKPAKEEDAALKEILSKVNEKMNYGFNSNKISMKKLVKIMNMPEYKSRVGGFSKIKKVTEIDKVNIIIEIITK